MTVIGMINANIVTRILNAMHKAKAMELVKEEVFYAGIMPSIASIFIDA